MATSPFPGKQAPRSLPRRLHEERRRQLRGLILLAFAVLFFCFIRAGFPRVFPHGWWKLW